MYYYDKELQVGPEKILQLQCIIVWPSTWQVMFIENDKWGRGVYLLKWEAETFHLLHGRKPQLACETCRRLCVGSISSQQGVTRFVTRFSYNSPSYHSLSKTDSELLLCRLACCNWSMLGILQCMGAWSQGFSLLKNPFKGSLLPCWSRQLFCRILPGYL